MKKWILPVSLLLLFACKKDDDKNESLPAPLSAIYNDSVSCGACKADLYLINYFGEKYYKATLGSGSGFCDPIVGAVFYDRQGHMVEINSKLHNQLADFGVQKDLVFTCK